MTDDTSTTAPAPDRRKRLSTGDLALVASFAALIAACALMPAIPTGGAVPITLQTFAVLLTGAVLGAKRAFLATSLYLAVGAAGLPVFSGGAGGLGVFAGPSVGYLVGFVFAATLCGFIVERLPRTTIAGSVPAVFLAGLGSSALFIHTFGILGMMLVLDLPLGAAASADAVFWIGDVVKNVAMAFVATAVHRAFPDLLKSR